MGRTPCARAASAAAATFSLGIVLPGAATTAARADGPVTFTKVIDQNAPLPGSTTPPPFYFEYAPAIDHGNIAFSTSRSYANHGLFVTGGSPLSRVVDRNTTLPNSAGAFGTLNGFAQDGDTSVFTSYGDSGFQGVFSARNGNLTTLVDGSTLVPATDKGPDARIGSVFVPSASGGAIAFGALTSRGQGVYTYVNGSFNAIADHFTGVPGLPGAVFSSVGAPIIRDGNVAFSSAQFSTPTNSIVAGQGIYRASAVATSGVLTKVVDTGTPKPGGGTFGDLIHGLGDQFQLLDFDGQNSVFGVSHDGAIYTDVGGTIRPVADQNTLVPGTDVPLTPSGVAAIDHGRIIFSATSQFPGAYRAIYAWDDGVITRLLSAGDVVDGETVAGFSFGADSLDGDKFATVLGFNDGPAGIYQAVVPEPGVAVIALLAGATLVRRRRRAVCGGRSRA